MTNTTSSTTFFVVTRNKRRIEEANYKNIHDAEARADKLRAVLRECDPSDVKNVSIARTKTPHKIR
jgi:hypothetical protein